MAKIVIKMEDNKMKEYNLKKAMKGDPAALEKLTAIIKAAEGKATSRTITADNVCTYLDAAERKLNIPKSAMDGISVYISVWESKFPNAYKYIPMGTVFTADYRDDHWVLTDVRRADCRGSHETIVTHTEKSKAAVIANHTCF